MGKRYDAFMRVSVPYVTGVSANQYAAVEHGPAFTLFLVCNVDGPDDPELLEIWQCRSPSLEQKHSKRW